MPTTQPAPQPHSLNAERAVLGAIVLDPDAILKVPALKPEHFYDPVYGMVYQAVHDMSAANEPIDFVTLSEKLKDNSKIESIGGSAFLADLATKVPTSSIIESYASIVIDDAIKRAYISAAQTIIGSAYDNKQSASDVQTSAEKELFSIGEQRTLGGFTPITTRTDQWYERLAENQELDQKDRNEKRLRSGMPSLDARITMRPGNITIVAGRTSMGKTAFALNLAVNACQQEKTVGFFSYEMTPEEIMDRVIASHLGIDSRQLEEDTLSDELYQQIGNALPLINKYQFYLEHNPDRLLSTLLSRARRLKKLHGLDLLVIDYLQLIYTTEKFAQQSRLQMVSHVSNTLKALAMELDVPIIVLSQLSRNPENRPDKKPQLSDLRESGEIEQDADIVLMLYREGYYEEDCENPDLTNVFIRKNRRGETGIVDLHFDRKHQRFLSIDRVHQPQSALLA